MTAGLVAAAITWTRMTCQESVRRWIALWFLAGMAGAITALVTGGMLWELSFQGRPLRSAADLPPEVGRILLGGVLGLLAGIGVAMVEAPVIAVITVPILLFVRRRCVGNQAEPTGRGSSK
jgi:hypothetical protein